ncbi:MAG: hydroxymethylbilane synthase [Gammaproteobacteria bacterium]|nr:hydroxymethylbilane synthase [Gammaproteobacteria bacterium]
MSELRIATRKSPLALWQAEHVAALLRAAHPGLQIELLPLTTRGDVLLDSPLAAIGGKGLFIKELERAILADEADLAVHSMKDVPAALPDGLALAAVTRREDPHDALVSPRYASLAQLPEGARVGTCSLRRQAQLLAWRPDLCIVPLRGNVNTRLAKLDAGEYDAIVLAAAGLQRLGLDGRIRERIDFGKCLPAIGQGIMGIECRSDAEHVHTLLRAVNHPETALCLAAERAFGARLEATCQVPLAGYAQLLPAQQIRLRTLVAATDGSRSLQDERSGPAQEAPLLGEQAAEHLLQQGADSLLAELRAEHG